MKRENQTRGFGIQFGILIVLLTVACADRHETKMTFERFLAQVYQEPESGLYIVDGDTPIRGIEALQEFYFAYLRSNDVATQPGIGRRQNGLIVHQVGGVDASWNETQRLNVTYCVSTAFGGNYNAVVQAMQDATSGAWEQVANVRLPHLAGEDNNCTPNNNNVVFDVQPTSGQPYLARAFFPNYARADRNILIDATAFGPIAPWTLAGILRHEVGHALGFRHEHTRPEARVCFEDNNWRALTPYDSDSVMHYPQCNGTNRGDLVLTQRDRDGAAALYPRCFAELGDYQPYLIAQPNGVVDVFWRTAGNTLGHKWYVGGTWYGPEDMGGSLASDPSPVTSSAGVLDVFWKGTDGNLWHRWYVDGWYGPQSLGAGPLGSAPQAVGQSTGTVDVFWSGTDTQLWHQWYVGGSWYGPEPMGGSLASDPSPVTSSAGVLDVFWKGTDGNLWHKWYVDGWYGPESLGAGPLGSAPHAVGQSTGTVDVFWSGTDSQLWHRWYVGGSWYGPEPMGGLLSSDPAPVTSRAGVLDVFWKGTDSNLWHKWFVDAWYGPENLGAGPLGSSPSAAGQPSGTIDVFWKGTDSQLWHQWFVDNRWYGPEFQGCR